MHDYWGHTGHYVRITQKSGGFISVLSLQDYANHHNHHMLTVSLFWINEEKHKTKLNNGTLAKLIIIII